MLSSSKTEAQAMLAVWQAALTAIAGGQEYQMKSTTLRRADLPEVRKMVETLQAEVQIWTSQGKPGARVRRIIPQDM